MNIPPDRDFFVLEPSTVAEELSSWALTYGEKRWLSGTDSTGVYLLEVRTLDFKSLEYRDERGCPGCTAIPEEHRNRYRVFIHSYPYIDLVIAGAEINVPVSNKKIYSAVEKTLAS
jgi:hypothetical protein